jgi:hypothetical protein
LCYHVVLVMFKTKPSVSTGLWFMVRVLIRVWALARVRVWFRIKNRVMARSLAELSRGLWLALSQWLGF